METTIDNKNVEIKVPSLIKCIGKRVEYILKHSKWSKNFGTIVEIKGKNISFNGDFRHFSDVVSIKLLDN